MGYKIDILDVFWILVFQFFFLILVFSILADKGYIKAILGSEARWLELFRIPKIFVTMAAILLAAASVVFLLGVF